MTIVLISLSFKRGCRHTLSRLAGQWHNLVAAKRLTEIITRAEQFV
jgi:hypothetical protein